jgi:hypothetical protein
VKIRTQYQNGKNSRKREKGPVLGGDPGPRTKKDFKNIIFSKNISKKPHQELVRY